MAWVYLDDGFPDHPKVAEAGGDAGWLFVCGLAYIKRYATEGRIPKGQVPKLSDRKAPARLAARLVATRLWVDEGDHYRVHDYGEWNRPDEARRAAAKKAAQARWRGHQKAPPGIASAYANAYADAMPEDYESQYEGNAETDASTCPLPLPPVVTSADNSHPPSGDASSEEDPNASPNDQPGNQLTAAAIDILARRDLVKRKAKTDLDAIGSDESWLATARANRRRDDGERLAELAELDPDATPDQLADALDRPETAVEHLTADGVPFIPSIGRADGQAKFRAVLAEPPPDDDEQAKVREIQDGVRERIGRPRRGAPA